MTYNVHGCVGTDGVLSYARIASVIAEAKPDVVALQELDVGRIRSAKVDQARVIANLLQMEFHFHPAMLVKEEEYGDAILSRHPMRLVQKGSLPKGPPLMASEPRGALWISINIEGHEWQVINTHFGLGRVERHRQARALAGADWVGKTSPDQPVIVCGDLNSRPSSRVHRIFAGKLRDAYVAFAGKSAATFATNWLFICLDYILVSRGIHVEFAEVRRGAIARLASDHYPVIADLRVASNFRS